MTDDDKKRIAEYMGWTKYPPECMGETVFFRDEIHGDIRWDLNAAALCIQEMQKRGDWGAFMNHTWSRWSAQWRDLQALHEFVLHLFNAENFFAAMSEWLKERGK